MKAFFLAVTFMTATFLMVPTLFAGDASFSGKTALVHSKPAQFARSGAVTASRLETANRRVRGSIPFNWEKGMDQNYRIAYKLHKIWMHRGQPKPSRYLRAYLWADPETESFGLSAGLKF